MNYSKNYGRAWNKIGDAIELLEEVSPRPSDLIGQLEKIAKEIYQKEISEKQKIKQNNLEEDYER